MPKRASNARCCAGGSGADAERAKRTSRHRGPLRRRELRPVEQIRDDRRHHVEPRRPVALDRAATSCDTLKRCGITMLPPATSGADGRDALAVDVVERQRRQHAIGATSARATAPRRVRRRAGCACDSSAPFGCPVVPDVYISSAGDRARRQRAQRAVRRIGASNVERRRASHATHGNRGVLREPPMRRAAARARPRRRRTRAPECASAYSR